jgi:3-oxoacyl-[acyl-carrier-protein] synthase-3
MPEAVLQPADDAAPAAAPLRGASILGIGVAVPDTVVGNAPIAARLGVDERWIVARTGVRERRVVSEGESVADLAAAAGARALDAAGTEASEVDLVLVATMSYERLSPNAAAPVAARIGATRAGALDLNGACSGFVAGLALAAGQIESGRASSVLVIGADALTRLVDPDDRKTAALFGDGAGAALIGASADGVSRIGPAVLGADGGRSELITAEREEAVIRMNGHDTFRYAVDRLCEATLAALERGGLDPGDVDAFVYHQANGRILAAVGERLGLEPHRVVDCIDRYGNTSAATVPMALAEAEASGLLVPGARALLAAFGGGLTWAATVVEWGGGR